MYILEIWAPFSIFSIKKNPIFYINLEVTYKDENFAKQIHLNWMKYKKVQILDKFILESAKDI